MSTNWPAIIEKYGAEPSPDSANQRMLKLRALFRNHACDFFRANPDRTHLILAGAPVKCFNNAGPHVVIARRQGDEVFLRSEEVDPKMIPVLREDRGDSHASAMTTVLRNNEARWAETVWLSPWGNETLIIHV